jgi:hypothetical protein
LRGTGRCALSFAIDWRVRGLDIRGWKGWRYVMIPTLLFCFREDGEGIRKHRVNAFYFLCVIQDVRLVSYKGMVQP